jgi:curved DNA-binding protein CbpA
VKNRRNYYRILHVQPDAPLEIIKSSYRALLLKLKKHPDLGGDIGDSILINEAKEVLTDPRKRSEYDRYFLKKHNLSRQSKSHGVSENTPSPGMAGMSSVFSGVSFDHVCRFCNKLEHYSVPLMPDTRCSSCRSPLYPMRKIKKSDISKRAFQRVAKDFSISFFIEWPPLHEYHGQTSQISPAGMQFCSDQYLQPLQIIKIHSRFVDAVAKVVYCFYGCLPPNNQSPDNIVGVEFFTLISMMTPGTFFSQTT